MQHPLTATLISAVQLTTALAKLLIAYTLIAGEQLTMRNKKFTFHTSLYSSRIICLSVN